MHRWRATQKLLGRAFVSAHHAKRSSLLSLPRVVLPSGSGLRCLEGALVSRWIWNWYRHNRVGNQRRPAGRLYFWLPFAPASGWRFSGSIFQITVMLSRLHLRELFQSPPHALGMAQSVLGGLCRSLRPPVLNGCLDRLAALIAASDSLKC